MCRVSYKDCGKYKQVTRKGFDTKKEALLKESDILLNIENGKDIDDNPREILTLHKYFEHWIYTYKIDRGLSKSTESKYLFTLNLVEDYFGNTPINAITRTMYQDFIDQRGKDRSKDTVEKTHNYIRSCVQDALHDGIIEKDFTYKTLLSYDIKEKTSAEKYWDLNEFEKIIKFVSNELKQTAAIILISALTGLRMGEVFGLSWDDIDFKEKTLSVNRGFDYVKTNRFTDGKTDSSIRTIIINDELILYLKKYKLVYGKDNNCYLFIDKIAKRYQPAISYTAVRKYLERTCKFLGIRNRSPHALRHTHCSVLLAEGIDLSYISQRLGHKTLNETIRTYSHIIKEKAQKEDTKVIDVLENISN